MRIFTLFGLLFLVSAARGHDYWLQPLTFTPAAKDVVFVSLHVGDHFQSESERTFKASDTPSLVLVGAKSKVDLLTEAKEGDKPFLRVACPGLGCHVLVMERAARLITLEAKKFAAYLDEEGLHEVLAERRKSGEDKAPGRERYSRSVKSYLRAGGKADEGWKHIAGHKLELAALVDPTGLKKGDAARFRVLFDGKGLVGVQVMCFVRQGEKTLTQKATTDKAGDVAFKMEHAGMHLVRLVYMKRTKQDKDADWESWWAAETFEGR